MCFLHCLLNASQTVQKETRTIGGIVAPLKPMYRRSIPMAHFAPGSQTRALLEEKERIAERLLKQGLTVAQICAQLRCSPHFVRQIRQRVPAGG
jgi:DNA-binding CsgD family transcriptional regulator